MKKILPLILLTTFSLSAFASEQTILTFFPKKVTCTNDVSGTYGKATGVAGEGNGEVDVRIVNRGGIKSSAAYRKTLCEALLAAKKNKTSVGVIVKNVTVAEPEENSHIQVVKSLTLNQNISE